MYAFDYVKPASLDEAAAALADGEAQAISGGQTLIPTLKQRLSAPSALVDLTGVEEMKGIKRDGDVLAIGAAETHGAVSQSAEVQGAIPALAALAGKIGDPQVRNRGTIGGSLANNDPSACYPSAALALGARFVTNKRSIEAGDYFQGLFETALEEDEILGGVSFPVPAKAAYEKFEQPASRFALVGVFAAQMSDGSARVAVTGAGDNGVFRVTALEEALSGNFTPEACDGVDVSADGLMSDIHGGAAYRAALIKALTKRAVAKAG